MVVGEETQDEEAEEDEDEAADSAEVSMVFIVDVKIFADDTSSVAALLNRNGKC